MKINESNKMIAEFMGVKKLPYGWYAVEGRTYAYNATHYPHNLRYNIYWDWLMPVVQKILNTDAGLNCYQLWVCDSLRTANIEEVYKSVLNYIESFLDNQTKIEGL